MTYLHPVQIARLAAQWHDAMKADPIETIKHTADQYRYTPEQIAETIEELRKIRPALVPPYTGPDAINWDIAGNCTVCGEAGRCHCNHKPEPFQLDSTPKPTFWKAPKQPKSRQTVLFSGLNLMAGQNDLFATDGSAE